MISSSFQKRLLNTIGVSRGFGDHHLLTADDKLSIKPFLSAVPEVIFYEYIEKINIIQIVALFPNDWLLIRCVWLLTMMFLEINVCQFITMQVRVFDIRSLSTLTDKDVLILGSGENLIYFYFL